MRALLIALTVLAASCSDASQQPASKASEAVETSTFLASISIPLGEHERLQSFLIETWGVRILAVCGIPPGWRVMAGGSAAPDGVIAATASHGVTWLKDMKPLESLVLVRLEGPVRKTDVGAVPATFQGKAVLDAGDDKEHERPLSHANVQLTAADRCPSPSLTN
jgi:hypothetical protein